MNFDYKVTSAPAEEPVTLAEAKAQCRIESSDTEHDTFITAAIIAAREELEAVTDRKFIRQTLELVLPKFPSNGKIELPGVPFISVTSIAYRDSDDAEQTLATSVYLENSHSEPGRIELADGQSWPATYKRYDAVKVTYLVGAADASGVSETIKHAIKMMTADLFLNRERTTEDGMQSHLQRSAKSLVNMNQTNARW